MVSCKLVGGLGNVIYQSLNCFAHSLKYGLDYALPMTNENPHYKGQKPYIFPGLRYSDNIPELPIYQEKGFTFEEIPFIDNVCFQGYFQSFRFFDDYCDQVLKALGFKWQPKPDSISLHFRAGDYRKFPDHHPIVSDKYIHNSIAYFISKGFRKFIIFSNEMETIKEIILQKNYEEAAVEFEYSEGRTEIEDMEYGSCCAGQILSNGTFSLFQYYLNQNPYKECTAPYPWFGKLLPHSTEDLIPKEAIIISNE